VDLRYQAIRQFGMKKSLTLLKKPREDEEDDDFSDIFPKT
jgi:hypothetical protein